MGGGGARQIHTNNGADLLLLPLTCASTSEELQNKGMAVAGDDVGGVGGVGGVGVGVGGDPVMW